MYDAAPGTRTIAKWKADDEEIFAFLTQAKMALLVI